MDSKTPCMFFPFRRTAGMLRLFLLEPLKEGWQKMLLFSHMISYTSLMRCSIRLISCLAIAFASLQAGHAGRPNIVLILADDMGWSDLGCYGSEIPTPSIDSLARQGMQATRCYTASRCSPSRASIMTGCEPHKVDVGLLDDDSGRPGYRGRLKPDIPTLPELLKKAGYRTYLSGKWHLGKVRGTYPWDRGFDRYRGLLGGAADYYKPMPDRPFGEDGRLLKPEDLPDDFYMTEDITKTALAYIDDAARAKAPFFLYVAYTAPHTPLQAPGGEIEKMLPLYEGKSPGSIAAKRLENQKRLGIVPTSAKLGMHNKFNPAGYEKTSAERKEYIAECMATYAAQISIMDRGIGKILESLDRHHLSGNTIVMFLSDNGATAEMPQNKKNKKTALPIGPLGEVGCRDGYGPMWAAVSNTPYRQYKIETFDGGLSAPFIIRYPKVLRSGTRYHSPFLLQDIAPTCLTWAKLPVPGHMDGKPLNSYWSKPASIPPEKVWDSIPNTCPPRTIFWEHQRNRAALTDKFKLVSPNRGPWQVYDIRDRTEQNNLAPQHKALVEQLSGQYRKWAQETHAE